MKKHQKHTPLIKPQGSNFNRNEIAILGTPCGDIQQLSYALTQSLSDSLKIAYVDADHKSGDSDISDPNSALTYGARFEYIDKIDFHRFDSNNAINSFDIKQHFRDVDLVLVNGNHFIADAQIVVIDPRKNLEKKLDRLTNVKLILYTEENLHVPSYLENHIDNIDQVPKLRITEVESIAGFLTEKTNISIPKIKGLVLAGGKSVRMKKDKGNLNYFGQPQREHMYEILEKLTIKSHLSVRPEQLNEIQSKFNNLADTFSGLGPYGAILSAFREDPNAAWLVVACDQPFLKHETLDYLIENRNVSKLATTFHNPETNFPEPLITLWEPRAYPRLLYFLSLGYSCPRKVLINSDVEVLTVKETSSLRNVNTPDEYEQALKDLESY